MSKGRTRRLALLSTSLGVLLSLPPCFATDVQVNVFGPKQYTQPSRRRPVHPRPSDTFQALAGAGQVIVQDGDGNGNNLVTGAIVLVNGVEAVVLNPQVVDQQGYNLQAPVTLNQENTISVLFEGPAGSYLTVQVVSEVTPDATSTQVIGIGGGTISVSNHLGDVITLTIPPLALAQDTSISVATLPVPLPGPIAQSIYPGAVLEPAGQQFSLPVDITVTLHTALQNPETAMLFWHEDSNTVLPLANQTITQNGVAGQNYHFSTVDAGWPTASEIAENITEITAGGPGIPATAVDKIDALLVLAAYCEQVGFTTEGQRALNAAENLVTKEDNAILSSKTAPVDPCGQNTLNLSRLAGLTQSFGLDSLASELLAQGCTFSVAPAQLFLDLGLTSQLVSALLDPKGVQRTCSQENWYSANLNFVDIAPLTSSFTIATGVAPGTANVSATCDDLLAYSQVTVCSATGNWSGSYSASNGNAGSMSAVLTETPGGSITGAMTITGVHQGRCTLTVPVTAIDANGTLMFAPIAGSGGCDLDLNQGGGEVSLSAAFSGACNTISGSFLQVAPSVEVGSFSMTRQQ